MTDEMSESATYREQCKNYTIGFAGGVWLTSASFGILHAFITEFPMYPIEWIQYESFVLAVAFYLIGCLVTLTAYYHPIAFYEMLEGSSP